MADLGENYVFISRSNKNRNLLLINLRWPHAVGVVSALALQQKSHQFNPQCLGMTCPPIGQEKHRIWFILPS